MVANALPAWRLNVGGRLPASSKAALLRAPSCTRAAARTYPSPANTLAPEGSPIFDDPARVYRRACRLRATEGDKGVAYRQGIADWAGRRQNSLDGTHIISTHNPLCHIYHAPASYAAPALRHFLPRTCLPLRQHLNGSILAGRAGETKEGRQTHSPVTASRSVRAGHHAEQAAGGGGPVRDGGNPSHLRIGDATS